MTRGEGVACSTGLRPAPLLRARHALPKGASTLDTDMLTMSLPVKMVHHSGKLIFRDTRARLRPLVLTCSQWQQPYNKFGLLSACPGGMYKLTKNVTSDFQSQSGMVTLNLAYFGQGEGGASHDPARVRVSVWSRQRSCIYIH